MAKTSTVTTAIENGILSIAVEGFDPIVIDPRDYPDDLVEQAALHGFKQKYADRAALAAGATPAEKHAAIMGIVRHHREVGEWNMQAGGDGTSGDGLLVRAIMEFNEMDRDAARTAVGALDKKTQAALRASPELKPIIERLRVAKAPKAAAPVADILARMKSL